MFLGWAQPGPSDETASLTIYDATRRPRVRNGGSFPPGDEDCQCPDNPVLVLECDTLLDQMIVSHDLLYGESANQGADLRCPTCQETCV